VQRLESKIADWKAEMLSRLDGDATVADELEDHLRAEINALTSQGRSESDAWRIATTKLGDAEALRDEFAQADELTLSDRFCLVAIAAGWAACALLVLVTVVARQASHGVDPVLGWHTVTTTCGYLAVVAAALLSAYCIVVNWRRNRTNRTLARVAAQATVVASAIAVLLLTAGFLLGGIWSQRARGQWWNGDPREFGGVVVVAYASLMLAVGWRRGKNVGRQLARRPLALR